VPWAADYHRGRSQVPIESLPLSILLFGETHTASRGCNTRSWRECGTEGTLITATVAVVQLQLGLTGTPLAVLRTERADPVRVQASSYTGLPFNKSVQSGVKVK